MDFTEEKKENLIQVDLKEIMESSFLDYSMSVIVSRALPDVRDGLKPVHRRILYTMYENSLWPEKAYRKCADTVGTVLGLRCTCSSCAGLLSALYARRRSR